MASEIAAGLRGPGSPRHALPPGRGRGSSVGSIVCYLTGLSHVDPVAAGLSLGRFLNREMAGVPDIDLDFPRDIREKLIVAVIDRYGPEHSALVASFSTYHARGAIRDLGKALGLPYAELERLARLTEGNPHRVEEELRALPGAEHEARITALARARLAEQADRRPATPHLAAPGRDGDLDATARRARPDPAGGDGRPADLPVGQGLVLRRRLHEDRPARAGDALRGRGLRRPHRTRARRDDRPVADPARRRRGVRRDPGGGHGRRLPDREPRADAEPAADAAGEPRRPDRAGGARQARADPGRRRPSVHRAAAEAARRPELRSRRPTIRCSTSRCARRSAWSSSRTRCSRWRWRSPASRSARRKDYGGR